MSEISNHTPQRVAQLVQLTVGLLEGQNGKELYLQHIDAVNSATPLEVILLFDEVMKLDYPISEVKIAVNRSLNLLHKTLDNNPLPTPEPNSFLWALMENNRAMAEILEELKPLIKQVNIEQNNGLIETIGAQFEKLLLFKKHYVLKENLLFPLIEKHFPQHRCLQIMWSFHDDILRNLKEAHEMLLEKRFEKIPFNRLVGMIFFNMLAIKFREEKILFPVMMAHIPQPDFDALLPESIELGYPYIAPQHRTLENELKTTIEGKIDLGTGLLTPEQIILLFNHLPVDITYVDENNRVQFFSTPEKRIFPRTKAIIGREVSKCHPPESVHVVNQIVELFRKGEKNEASFWIHMKGNFVLIRYFAVRNNAGEYKGVIEVTQEIGEIQQLEGDKRLLDW